MSKRKVKSLLDLPSNGVYLRVFMDDMVVVDVHQSSSDRLRLHYPVSGRVANHGQAGWSENPQVQILVTQEPQTQQTCPNRRCGKRAIAFALAIFTTVVLLFTLPITLERSHKKQVRPIGTTVQLDYGTYSGNPISAEVNSFLGMRFAAPPTGERRWRAPAPPEAFEGIQNATHMGSDCKVDEDCLFVNVYAPSSATENSKLPVWFYIQGGGYAGLCCNNNNTQVVATGNIIVVSINYRVGAFGFLASEQLRNDDDLNIGLLDQRAALGWTRKNIHKWGGNPDHIIIHGASAGAGSVAHHLVAYGGRNDDLFIGAAAQSPYIVPELPVADLEWQFKRYVSDAHCNHTDDVMSCLRSQDLRVLQAANTNQPFPGRQNSSSRAWGPVIDGDFLQDHVLNLFEQGKFIDVPMMIGDEPYEATMLAPNATTPEEVEDFFNQNDPTLNSTQLQSIVDWYPQGGISTIDHANYYGVINQAYSEATFICPGMAISQAMSNRSASVWNYNFNVSTTDSWSRGLGAWHTIDGGAIFGPYAYGIPLPDPAIAYQTYNAKFVDYMMNYYLSFVKTLSPNTLKHADAPNWGSFIENGIRQRLNLESSNTGMMNVTRSLADTCAFWRGLQRSSDLEWS
ncbi:alpha/beta-hydrolase [Myriangium duriaei CBS 260.36]|uniref:Alpha/beta-hydrolase n=1 Tax=Myriangium duriaei CBS 260.36 TaxID=1168546 RepID=A0A9P4MIE1_9PEZI|nr:alpha/beta-hydrolase [Myriangium duriaei CBS 260.36]